MHTPVQLLVALVIAIGVVIVDFPQLLRPCDALSSGNGDDDALSFLVIGDWGTGNANQMRVARALRRLNKESGYKYRMLLSTGDQFYPSGVTSASDAQWEQKFEKAFYPERAHSDEDDDEEEEGSEGDGEGDGDGVAPPLFFPTLGNHDCEGNIASQVEYTRKSKHWRMPHEYYVEDVPLARADGDGNDGEGEDGEDMEEKAPNVLRLVVLNACSLVCGGSGDAGDETEVNHRCASLKETGGDRDEQMRWLADVLDETHGAGGGVIMWKVVMAHWPVFSVMGNGPTRELVDSLAENLLGSKNVDMYFSGHDHSLQHHQPRTRREGAGHVDYFVSGAGGYELHTKLKKGADGARLASNTTAADDSAVAGQKYVSELNLRHVDTQFAAATFGFMAVDIEGSEATVSFHASESDSGTTTVIYSTTLTRSLSSPADAGTTTDFAEL